MLKDVNKEDNTDGKSERCKSIVRHWCTYIIITRLLACKVFKIMVTLFFYSVNTLNNEDYFLPGVRGVTVLLLLPGCRAAVMNGWRWGAILP